MHFSVMVVLPKDNPTEASVEDRVTALLAPYDEDNEMFADGSRWDWWVIGGRWDGALTGIGPETREVVCRYCGGTGKRSRDSFAEGLFNSDADWEAWLKDTGGCNVCHGSGKETEYVNQYQNNIARNSCLVKDIKTDGTAAVVTPDGQWHEQGRMGWFGTILDEQGEGEKPEAEWKATFAGMKDVYAEHVAVLVDCHV